MNISWYCRHPHKAFRYLFYYIFSQTIGRLAYPSSLRHSKWFNGIWSNGHKWIFDGFFNNGIGGGPFPVGKHVKVVCPQNIVFHPDDLNNFHSFGIYFQAIGRIELGKGSYIGPNVGLITQNHNLQDPSKRGEARSIVLGESCWIGMNSVILPGVILGPHTVVGAGSVVTKSFPDGFCVIAGNPAKVIKQIQID